MTSIVHELHLDNKINQALHKHARADFGLMLAMLSQDASEFALFQLEKEQLAKHDGKEEQALKVSLGIHPNHRLEVSDDYYQLVESINNGLHQGGMAGMKLATYMVNDVLAEHNDVNKIDEHVLANCSNHSLRRLQASQSNKPDDLAVTADITKMADIVDSAKAYVA